MDATMRTGLKILHVIFFLLLLGSDDFQVRGLKVIGTNVKIEALRGENVTIPCQLSDVPTPLNLQIVSVIWTLKLQNGTEHEVYGFRSSSHQPWRNGSHMNKSDLQQGNASLYIPNIQIEDEGEYHCFVIITPHSVSTKPTLNVSVIPQTTVTYNRQIEAGFIGYVVCNINNFYPEDVKIRWVKYSEHNNCNSSLDRDVFFTRKLRNSDGTYNMTSLLTVKQSAGIEPGDLLFCIVSYSSLREEKTQSFTMPRRNPFWAIFFTLFAVFYLQYIMFFLGKRMKRWRPWIRLFEITLLIMLIILVCLFINFMEDIGDLPVFSYISLFVANICAVIVLIYYGRNSWTYFIKGNLTVSEISGDQLIFHEKRTTLTCQITEFRQKEIKINVYLKRINDIKRHHMASWESADRKSSNDSSKDLLMAGDQRENSHTLPILEKGAKSRTLLPVEMKAEMTKSRTGLYNCLFSITITPNKDTDDKAVIGVEVEHASLKWPITVWRTLHVHREVVYINASDIIGETWIPHMKKTTLSCQITECRPKDIHINLYLKRRNDTKKHLIHSWASMGRLPEGNNTKLPVEMEDAVNDTMLPVEMEDAVNDTKILLESEDVVNDTMLPVEMEVEMTEKEEGSYKCDCRIFLTPNIDTDDGAVLTLQVAHAALEWPKYKYHILNVIKGDKPSLWRRWKRHVIKLICDILASSTLLKIFPDLCKSHKPPNSELF